MESSRWMKSSKIQRICKYLSLNKKQGLHVNMLQSQIEMPEMQHISANKPNDTFKKIYMLKEI